MIKRFLIILFVPVKFSIICNTMFYLQVTSLFRNKKYLYGVIGSLENKTVNPVVGVFKIDHSQLWSNILPYMMDEKIRIAEAIVNAKENAYD